MKAVENPGGEWRKESHGAGGVAGTFTGDRAVAARATGLTQW